MNVKDFEYIVEIANQGNITRAAERLYITQSALSNRSYGDCGSPGNGADRAGAV